MTVSEVWNLPSVIAAAIAGLLYAPIYHVSVASGRRHRRSVFLIAVNVIVLTTFQTVGQVIAAIWVGDQLWPRIVSREFLYIVFAIALGLALGLAMFLKGRA